MIWQKSKFNDKNIKKRNINIIKNNINVFTTSNSNNISSSPKNIKGINPKLLIKRKSAMNVRLKGELSDIRKYQSKKFIWAFFI